MGSACSRWAAPKKPVNVFDCDADTPPIRVQLNAGSGVIAAREGTILYAGHAYSIVVTYKAAP